MATLGVKAVAQAALKVAEDVGQGGLVDLDHLSGDCRLQLLQRRRVALIHSVLEVAPTPEIADAQVR